MSFSNTGVYAIINLTNGNFYIGSAACTSRYPSMSGFRYRWRIHRHHLRKGTHHCAYLQNAWKKYGENSFEFKILEIVEPENCINLEQIYLDCADKNLLYNSQFTADSMLGCKHTEEAKLKISESKSLPFYLVDPEGREIFGKNLRQFCKSNNLNENGFFSLITGECSNYKGYTTSIKNHEAYKELKLYRGIHFVSRGGSYRVRWRENNKTKSKSFKDLEEAILFRDTLEIEGKFFKVQTGPRKDNRDISRLVEQRKKRLNLK